jgi:IS30 family transposase
MKGVVAMSHYKHLTIEEREKLYLMRNQGASLRKIAAALNRSPSTISREIGRNKKSHRPYSPSAAQNRYMNRRKHCGKKPILSDATVREKIRGLIQDQHWSPEQTAFRLKLEDNPIHISYTTIYRGVKAGFFDPKQRYLRKNERFSFYLRRKGKKRRKNGEEHKQSKFRIPYTIAQRPAEAEDRSVLGYWEADTVAGTKGSASVVTLAERKSRYLLACKLDRHTADAVSTSMIRMMEELPPEKVKGITPDRGKEFAMHEAVTAALHGVNFYFADPYSPWQRGTNENTNGLLRECIPKGQDIAPVSNEELARFVKSMNLRPRKCLGWRSPYEVFYNTVLHLT